MMCVVDAVYAIDSFGITVRIGKNKRIISYAGGIVATVMDLNIPVDRKTFRTERFVVIWKAGEQAPCTEGSVYYMFKEYDVALLPCQDSVMMQLNSVAGIPEIRIHPEQTQFWKNDLMVMDDAALEQMREHGEW